VFAVPGLFRERINARGTPVRDSHVGYDAANRPLPAGELVPRHPHYLRAIARGELSLVAPEAGV
jgi:hypothetical protein